ncbi:hypothetical protein Bhyg_17878 [Pseudolycoriella hygida]|jgi:chromosome segregation ATPase
MYFV